MHLNTCPAENNLIILTQPKNYKVKACSNEANLLVQHHSTLLDATCWSRLNTMLDDGTMLASFTSFAIMWKDCGTSSIPLFLLLQSGLGGGEGGGGLP